MKNRQSSDSRVKTDFVSLPSSFFTQVMPEIQDIIELKVALHVSYLIQQKQGHPCFITYNELLSQDLMAGMDEGMLRQALNSAVDHGALLHSTSNINGKDEDIYVLKADRRQPSAINIFALYEQNIGIITPMIAEELKEAEKRYPPQWIEEAFKEAVTMNKRSWKYIARILERWASEGKDSGEHRRDIKKGGSDKYIKGKYGHLVKR
jgi:DnaD/phage-associated family protein